MSLTLFCVIDGDSPSQSFPVHIDSNRTIGELKKLVWAEKKRRLDSIDAADLTLWGVFNLVTDDNDHPTMLEHIPPEKLKKLSPLARVSVVFTDKLPQGTIHVVVQPPIGMLPQRYAPDTCFSFLFTKYRLLSLPSLYPPL